MFDSPISLNPRCYSRSYSNINDASARPLGYKVGRYVYDNQQSICVKVPGTKDRRVEVRFETEPAAVLCVKSNIGNDNEPACSTVSSQNMIGMLPAPASLSRSISRSYFGY